MYRNHYNRNVLKFGDTFTIKQVIIINHQKKIDHELI